MGNCYDEIELKIRVLVFIYHGWKEMGRDGEIVMWKSNLCGWVVDKF